MNNKDDFKKASESFKESLTRLEKIIETIKK